MKNQNSWTAPLWEWTSAPQMILLLKGEETYQQQLVCLGISKAFQEQVILPLELINKKYLNNMNCYNHPDLPAVSSCIDCNKGLCIECSSRYTFPICVECNKNRISHERSEIIKDFFIIFGGGAVITFIVLSLLNSQNRDLPIMSYIMFFYAYSSLVAGWRFLNRITADYFLFLPIIGWLIYFVIKFLISGFLGIFILPYRIYKNVTRLRELNQID